MHLKKLLRNLVFLLVLPVCAFGQEKAVQSTDQAEQARTLQENQKKKRTGMIKSVPVTNKNIEAIRHQNKKVTQEQMHQINRSMRKSMIIHKRR